MCYMESKRERVGVRELRQNLSVYLRRVAAGEDAGSDREGARGGNPRAVTGGLDSSALVKLVLPEPETEALTELLLGWPERFSSALARVEVLRAVRRAGVEKPVYDRAENVVARIGLVTVDERISSAASWLYPPQVRSLEAIHLATSLSVRELGGVVSYDARLAEASKRSRIPALAPGAEG